MASKNDDSKTLYTVEGDAIPWMNKDYNNHLDKTTLIFGGTGSGKTTIIEEILYLLKDHVPNFLVLAPDTSNSAYCKKLPMRCIKDDLTKAKLIQLWERQRNATRLYNTANDITILERVFKKIADKQSIVLLECINRRTDQIINYIENNREYNIPQKKSQRSSVEELRNKKIKTIYKDAIRQNLDLLKQKQLDLHERIAVEFLDFNPRLCLIIDDCSEKFQVWMKMFKKSEVNPFEAIFYKNRWNYLTLIFAAHDDKLVNTELRKNARITIYTNSQALVTSINRQGNGFTPKERKEAMRFANRLFGDEENKGIKTHQKLCYVREDAHPFKYTIATPYPDFTIGCEPTRKLIAKMPKKDDNIVNNPLIKDIVKKESPFVF
jgi:molybdopterin-guanine dinucleotide biosynthesis protein